MSLDVFPDLIDFLKKLCLEYDWVEGGYQLLKLPDRCVVKDATVMAFNYNSTANEPILVASSVETQRLLTVQAARTENKNRPLFIELDGRPSFVLEIILNYLDVINNLRQKASFAPSISSGKVNKIYPSRTMAKSPSINGAINETEDNSESSIMTLIAGITLLVYWLYIHFYGEDGQLLRELEAFGLITQNLQVNLQVAADRLQLYPRNLLLINKV